VSTDPTPNLQLIRRVLNHIDTHPETWTQSRWYERTPCGTAHCVGGWALAFNGNTGRLVFLSHSVARSMAQQALGLTGREARALFNGGNSRADVQRTAEAVAARAGERL
jgi:hypothetical protein